MTPSGNVGRVWGRGGRGAGVGPERDAGSATGSQGLPADRSRPERTDLREALVTSVGPGQAVDVWRVAPIFDRFVPIAVDLLRVTLETDE